MASTKTAAPASNDADFEDLVAGLQEEYKNADVRFVPPPGNYPSCVLTNVQKKKIAKQGQAPYMAVILTWTITGGELENRTFDHFLGFKDQNTTRMSKEAIAKILGSSEGIMEDIAQLEASKNALLVDIDVVLSPNKNNPSLPYTNFKYSNPEITEDTGDTDGSADAEPEPEPEPEPAKPAARATRKK